MFEVYIWFLKCSLIKIKIPTGSCLKGYNGLEWLQDIHIILGLG